MVAGLPDLLFSESKQGYNSLDFRNELTEQLTKTDLELAKTLYLAYDNKNLLNILFEQNKSFNLLGNYKKDFLENQITEPVNIPNYMIRFIKWAKNQETNEINLQIENKLHSLYFEQIITTGNNFLNQWFKFELNTKNILTAFNCVQFNYSIEKHLIQVTQNNTMYSLLLNKHLKPELFEEDLPFAHQIFRIAELNISPEEREKVIDKIKWDYLDEQTFFHYFTVEKILSYIIKIGIIERWMKLDAETGKALLDKLINELKHSYTFPEEFSTV